MIYTTTNISQTPRHVHAIGGGDVDRLIIVGTEQSDNFVVQNGE